MKIRITEVLDVDIEHGRWHCNRCSHDLGPAERSYKEGILIAERDPREIHEPLGDSQEYNYSFHPDWVRLIEFYCPNCGTMLETEYLPPGHPLTWDIDLDLAKLREKYLRA